MKYKLCIVGLRNPGISYENRETLNSCIKNLEELLKLSPGEWGIDTYGKILAKNNHIPFKEYIYIPQYEIIIILINTPNQISIIIIPSNAETSRALSDKTWNFYI